MLSITRLAPFAGTLVLTACSGDIAPSRDFDPAFFIGTESASASANGLAFADGTQELSDVEGQLLQVRLARFERDPTTGQTVLIASDETATLPATYTDFVDFDATVTLDGEPLVFADGEATLPSGQKIRSYMNFRLIHSGTGAIYTNSGVDADFTDPIELEGFFAIGHETDPSVIAARSDSVTYSTGGFFGYVQVFDENGALIDSDMRTNGALTLEAEFARARVSGLLEARLDPPTREELADDPDLQPFASLELVFLAAPITGNGFVGAADLTCPAGHSCQSNTSVGGAFYGPNGEEVSGVIALDESISGPDGFSFVGAAGFSTTSGTVE